MAVDKTLEIVYDLSSLNQEQAGKLIAANEEVIKKAEKQKKKGKRKTAGLSAQDVQIEKRFEKLKKKLEFDLISGKGKNSLKQKLFGKSTFKNLIGIGSNPQGFLLGGVTKLIPFIGTALVITGVFAALIKRVDDFQKKFVDNVDARIDLFRSKETQAQIQAGLQQLIITSVAGSAEPRDAYNTFQVFNTDQSRIEADFRLRDTTGVD